MFWSSWWSGRKIRQIQYDISKARQRFKTIQAEHNKEEECNPLSPRCKSLHLSKLEALYNLKVYKHELWKEKRKMLGHTT